MWWRQVARAAGASLIAPLVLLLAAGVVASGGGLGGLDSLGQIASGPSLPETGLETESSSSIEGAEIVGAEPAGAAAGSTPGAGQAELASASPPTRAPAADATAPQAETDVSSQGQAPATGSPPTGTGDGTLVGKPDETRPPIAPDRVDDLQETTQGLGQTLTEPLRPVSNGLVDLLVLLGLPQP